MSNFSFYINSIFRYFYMYHFIYQFWCVSNRMILHTTCTNYFFPYNYLIFNVNILSLILWITLIWHLLENYCSSIFNFVETGLLLFVINIWYAHYYKQHLIGCITILLNSMSSKNAFILLLFTYKAQSNLFITIWFLSNVCGRHFIPL